MLTQCRILGRTKPVIAFEHERRGILGYQLENGSLVDYAWKLVAPRPLSRRECIQILQKHEPTGNTEDTRAAVLPDLELDPHDFRRPNGYANNFGKPSPGRESYAIR